MDFQSVLLPALDPLAPKNQNHRIIATAFLSLTTDSSSSTIFQ
jgi:hypothetical protein